MYLEYPEYLVCPEYLVYLEYPEYLEYAESLEDVLKKADFLSLHMPATDETYHMIGKEQFGMMKDSAYLINAARGAVVDTEALIEALKSGDIAGAGLDVYEVEPLPEDSPLFELTNCVMTPHCAAATIDGLERSKLYTALNIIEFLEGKELSRIVRG